MKRLLISILLVFTSIMLSAQHFNSKHFTIEKLTDGVYAAIHQVSSHQTLKVYDVLGNEVATLVEEYKPAGSYTTYFDGSKLSTGVYFYLIKIDGFIDCKKMLFIKYRQMS